MIQILCHPGHEKRGKTLATKVPGSHYASINTPATKKEGLDTLTFWGHGEYAYVCKMTPIALAALIKTWKKKNKGLNTVEIITCNARHFAKPFSNASYVNKLKAALKAGVLSSTRNIVVKALPVYKTGAENAWSILLAEEPTKSWCYVMAPGKVDTSMHRAADLVRCEGMKYFKGDIAIRAHQIVNDIENVGKKWTMMYGHFKDIRGELVVC